MIQPKARYLNHMFIFFIESDDFEAFEGDEENDLYIGTDLCSLDAYNTNDHLGIWRTLKIDDGVYIVSCDAKPHIDYNEFISSYNCESMKILYSDRQAIESYPWFFDSSITNEKIKTAYNRYISGKDQSFKEIVNFKENGMINILKEYVNKEIL